MSAGTATGTVNASNDGTFIDVTTRAPFTGTVQGTVFAGDGTTPVPGSLVAIAEVGAPLSSRVFATTNQNGFYSRSGVRAGAVGFTVVANSPSGPSTAQQTASFLNDGATVTVNLTLPVSVISGTVFYADGITRTSRPDVFLTQTDAAGNTTSFFSRSSDTNGNYTIFGPISGEFILTAQDFDSGLTKSVPRSLAAGQTSASFNITLPPSGTVMGVMRDSSGNPVPSVDVVIANSGNNFVNFATTDSAGAYRFEHIATGIFSIGASDPGGKTFASAMGNLTNDGETVVIDLILPGTGTVSGTAFAADGVTPLQGAQVVVQNFANASDNGFSKVPVTTNQAGAYVAHNVQVGNVQVAVLDGTFDPNRSVAAGIAEGVLDLQPLTVNPIMGNAINLFSKRFVADGTNGFRYTVNCDGEVQGGRADNSLSSPYNFDSALLILNGARFTFPCAAAGFSELSGRQLVIGESTLAGLKLKRKIFVPASGKFARYLEIISNPTGVAMAIDIGQNFRLTSTNQIKVHPSSTNNTYLVLASLAPTIPVVAEVMAGPNAPVQTGTVTLEDRNASYFYNWNRLILSPGQTAILMHFVLQGNPSDLAGLQTQAQALVNLSDPEALFGMTTAEKSNVVNFNVPTGAFFLPAIDPELIRPIFDPFGLFGSALVVDPKVWSAQNSLIPIARLTEPAPVGDRLNKGGVGR